MNKGFEGTQENKRKRLTFKKGMASPWDRFAAFVVDIVFLFPFLQILQAPLRRQIKTAVMMEANEVVMTMELFKVLIVVVTFVLYRASCHYLFGKTLGKKVFGLRVQHGSGDRNFLAMVMRSFVLLGELFIAGWPLLSVFSHYRRRPWHDRLSDTYVVSLKNLVSPPVVMERRKAQWASAVMILAMLMMSFLTPVPTTPDLEVTEQEATVAEDCEIFIESSDGSMTRAIEAFSVSNIDSDCLMYISTEALWRNEDPVFANLGSAFAGAKDPDFPSRKYKEEVCRLDPEGTPCFFVKWTDKKPLETDAHFDDIVSILKRRDAEDFYRVFFVTALHSHGEYEKAGEVLESVKDPDRITDTMAKVTFENLMWRGKWEAGYWVFKLKKLDGDDFSDFVETAMEKRAFARGKLKRLIEKFYPQMEISGESRGLASENNAPASMKMLWIRLSGDK